MGLIMYKRIIYGLILTVFIAGISFSKGLKPYNFSLKDENGKVVSLESLKGNVVYLIFWTTTCHSCKEELPIVNRLYKKYKDKGVKFYAVVIDTKELKRIKEVKESLNIQIPVLIGNRYVKSKYRVYGVPVTYILRKDLSIGKVLYGINEEEYLERLIQKFLKEKKDG